MKKCSKCGSDKNGFYRDKTKSDGLSSSCEECVKKTNRSYKENNPEKVKQARDKWREDNPDAGCEWRKKNPGYSAKSAKAWRENNPDKVKKYEKKWKAENKKRFTEIRRGVSARQRARYPDRFKARSILNRAVKGGKVKRLPCEKCGSTYWIEAHHDDYSKPLEVRWFCRKHHTEHHATAKKRFHALKEGDNFLKNARTEGPPQ